MKSARRILVTQRPADHETRAGDDGSWTLSQTLFSFLTVEAIERQLQACLEPGAQVPEACLLELAVHDERLYVRQRVAEIIGNLVRPDMERLEKLLQRLSADRLAIVRQTAADSLARMIQRSRPMMRSRIAAEWSVHPTLQVRACIAIALGKDIEPFIGDLAALSHLAADQSAEVRLAAAQATARRFHHRPRACLRILERLASDNRRSVRLAALEGLERASRAGLASQVAKVAGRQVNSTDPQTAVRAADMLVTTSRESTCNTLQVVDELTTLGEGIEPRAMRVLVEALANTMHERPDWSKRILRRLCHHDEPFVQRAAERVLREQ